MTTFGVTGRGERAREARFEFKPIAASALRTIVLLAIATFLILVLLPAALVAVVI